MRSLTHLLLQNEELSILKAQLQDKKVTLLRPNLANYEMYHFDKYDELIEIGYTGAKGLGF